MEQYCRNGKDIHIVFIDMEKTLNSIPRKVLCKEGYKEEMSLKCLNLSDEREYKVGSQKTFLKL
jgi:uncharacterized protein (DUF111 family)